MTSSNQPQGEATLHNEANFRHHTTSLTFSRKEIALVLVDLWDTGFGPEPLTHLGWEAEYNLGKSFCDRAAEIELTRLLPLLESCRKNGVAVVHCPSADIAVKHPQWETHATDEDRNPPSSQGESAPPSWPPTEWTSRWRDAHTNLIHTQKWITDYYAHIRPNQNIPEPLRPVDGDLVVTTGNMMHRLLREREIKVLFYCGFATNLCLIFKPGAIQDMYDRGYMPLVVRDATTGSENAETIQEMRITNAFIDQIEILWSYSVTSSDLIEAFESGETFELLCRYLRMNKPMEQ